MSFWSHLFGFEKPPPREAGKAAAPSAAERAAQELLAVPQRATLLAGIRDRLSDLPPDDQRELVDGIALRFALWVANVPASEEYHHAASWGLLDHSLEVASRSVAAASQTRFTEEAPADPGREYELLPRWRYAAFVFGLLHDVGKIAQLRVETVSGETWNAFREPLAEFLLRLSLWPPVPGKAAVTWVPRRGLDVHERHNSFFVGRIVTPAAAAYLGPVLPLAMEQRTAAANALAGVVTAADSESVLAERRSRLVDAEARDGPGRPAFVRSDSLVADTFPVALQHVLESGKLALNGLDGDAFVGERYVAVRYPGAVLKVMETIRDRWGAEDVRAKNLRMDLDGVKRFVRELALRQFVFRDRASGTWKLKATVRLEGREDKTFLVLAKKDILAAPEAFNPFRGRISLYSMIDLSPVAVDDFSVADAPSAPAVAASRPAATPSAAHAAPATSAPAPESDEKPPSESDGIIDPGAFTAKIREMILNRKLATNVIQGACFVTAEITYVVWPRGLALVREAMGLKHDPFKDKRPYYLALSQMPCVLKDAGGELVVSIRFKEGAPICRVVRMYTEGLLPDPGERQQVGVWPEAITIAPPDVRVEPRRLELK